VVITLPFRVRRTQEGFAWVLMKLGVPLQSLGEGRTSWET
jgi:hypothetical protein